MADIDALTTALTDTLRRGDATIAWLQPVVLRLVAGGEPVTLEQVAQATGRPMHEVREALAGLPDTEFDDTGRIVGWGITQRETPHRFNVGGRHLFTWCALDTLMFPALLGKAAAVSSPCHATSQPVQLQVEVNPDRVSHVNPPEAVVSIVTPGRTESIRAAFCNQVHFFSSAAAAGPWLAEHPEATVVPVAEAFALGRPLAAQLNAGVTDCR